MRAQFLCILLASTLLFSCKKETVEFTAESIAAYLPIQTGKYITYRTDSTVFTNFGANTVVRSYQEKHQVDAEIRDNLGRPSYRVFRFIRDTSGTTPWKPTGSYFITKTDKTIEVVEDNLRFLKLAGPVAEGNTWKGNRFLPYDPYGIFYEFSNDDAMVDWNYLYTDVGSSKTINGKRFDSTITVEQEIEFPEANVRTNFQVESTQAFGSKSLAVDQYAKGIGLIYQELIMWEYQPPSSPRPGYRGFGVKRTIIDHN